MSGQADLDNPEKMASLIASDATWTPDPEGPSDIQADVCPTYDEIQAVVGDLPPQAAGRALAAHMQIDIQAAYDLLDGFYWHRMWDSIAAMRQKATRD
jgi:hypothetical protein